MGDRPVRASVALAAAALTVLVGCSSPPSGPANRAPASASGSPSAAEIVEDVTVASLLDRIEDGIAGAASVSWTAEGDGLHGSGTLDLATGDTRMIAETPEYWLNIVLLDGRLYVSEGDAIAAPWEERDVDSLELPSVDPLESLAQWRAGATVVTPRGDDALQGVRLARYELTVDVAKVLAASGATPAADAPERVGYSVWLDDEDRPRRVVLTAGAGRQTLDYSEWGAPVEIVAPVLGSDG